MRYRIIGERHWHMGTVVNLSATGVLFRGEHVVEVNSMIEVAVNVPKSLAEGQSSKMVSRGKVVRVSPDDTEPGSTVMATSFSHLRILRD